MHPGLYTEHSLSYIGWPTSPMHQRIFLDRIDVCSQPWDSVCHICSIHLEDHQL
jgi:hypothetical protein